MNPMVAKNTYLSKGSHCNRAIISEAFMLQFITCKCSELCKHFSEDWRLPNLTEEFKHKKQKPWFRFRRIKSKEHIGVGRIIFDRIEDNLGILRALSFPYSFAPKPSQALYQTSENVREL